MVHGFAARLLGGHVLGSAGDNSALCQANIVDGPR